MVSVSGMKCMMQNLVRDEDSEAAAARPLWGHGINSERYPSFDQRNG